MYWVEDHVNHMTASQMSGSVEDHVLYIVHVHTEIQTMRWNRI